MNAFEIKGLIKHFPEFSLGPINLNMEPGMVLGFVGPNGSGKTTTMHSMVGLIKPDGGEIKIFDRANDPNDISWKFDIGYVGDKHVFYEHWSGKKNLEFLKQFYPNWDLDFEAELIKRFEVPINKKAKDLSTGNRVKLSLIGALAHRPKLLILDEPTSGLDPVVRSEFLDIMFEVVESGERAVFYSTHILSDISKVADELAFIKNGKIVKKTLKDDLTENWRRISFRFDNKLPEIENIFMLENEGSNYKIVSDNFTKTMKELDQIGVVNQQEVRMSVDEIAVHILKSDNGK